MCLGIAGIAQYGSGPALWGGQGVGRSGRGHRRKFKQSGERVGVSGVWSRAKIPCLDMFGTSEQP